jgi:Zn-dependent metalloprotease
MLLQSLLKTCFLLAGLVLLTESAGRGFAQGSEMDKVAGAAKSAVEQLERTLGRKLEVTWNVDNGTPLFLTGELTVPGFSASHPSKQAAALSFLREYSALFQIKEPAMELQLMKSKSDELGMTHLRFQQKHKEIPVWGAELLVHFSKAGAISSINGRYVPSFNLAVTPTVTNEKAEAQAQAHVQSIFGEDPGFGQASAKLIIFPKGETRHLAWLVSAPNRFSAQSKCIIDAIAGEVLWVDTGIRN